MTSTTELGWETPMSTCLCAGPTHPMFQKTWTSFQASAFNITTVPGLRTETSLLKENDHWHKRASPTHAGNVVFLSNGSPVRESFFGLQPRCIHQLLHNKAGIRSFCIRCLSCPDCFDQLFAITLFQMSGREQNCLRLRRWTCLCFFQHQRMRSCSC